MEDPCPIEEGRFRRRVVEDVLHLADEEEHELFNILRAEKEESELTKLHKVFKACFEKAKPETQKKRSPERSRPIN